MIVMVRPCSQLPIFALNEFDAEEGCRRVETTHATCRGFQSAELRSDLGRGLEKVELKGLNRFWPVPPFPAFRAKSRFRIAA